MTALAVVMAGLLGTLPLGHLVARWARAVDVRRLAVLNLGLPTVARRLGAGWLVAITALDLAKGALAVLVASRVGGLAALDLAPAAVLAGHLYSPYFAAWDPPLPRSRGAATAAGAWLALALTGQVGGVAAALPPLVWLLVLLGPRLRWGRWGYPSLATVLAAAAGPVAAALAGKSQVAWGLGLAAALVVWRHKENIGRLLDGVELRLGDRRPLPDDPHGEAAAAFFIHAMNEDDWWQSARFAWVGGLVRRGWLPTRWLAAATHLVRPIKVDEITGIRCPDGQTARVYLIGVPMLPADIKAGEDLARRRAVQAARLADELGASVLGLGAYWSVVGDKGAAVQRESPVAVTNGGAYTAGSVGYVIPRALAALAQRGRDPATATAAVVGAGGVVGFGICRVIAGQVRRLLLVGTDRERLERSADLLRRRFADTEFVCTTSPADLREAGLVFSATSQPGAVIYPEHVAPGTLLYDLGRPADVHPDVARVPGVEVVPGGVVRLPGEPRWRIDLGYGAGLVPACLAESVIIALDRAFDRCTLGPARAENIRYFVERGDRLGFVVVTRAEEMAS